MIRGVLMLADDDPAWKWDPVEQARAACEGGATGVQLRAKHATDTEALDWAETIRELTRRYHANFFVNDRFDLALASDADGVHLGQHDLPPAKIPADARARLSIGRSTHDRGQAEVACREAVDYVAFGPVFGTQSKTTGYSARGLSMLAEVVRCCAPRPVVAIGGIDSENARKIAVTGAAGIAVISSVAAAPDPVAAARSLVAEFAAGESR